MSVRGPASGRFAEREARAKINLVLDLLGPRADGYTEIATIFQAVELADTVRLRLRGAPGPVRLAVEGTPPCPPGENLAVRAAEAWRASAGVRSAVDIELVKRIPAGAGLGGGSSDAAAVLRLLEAAHDRALGEERLSRLAAGLGADVPYFLVGGLALGEGRGERLTPLEDLPEQPVVLARAGAPLPTAAVFAAARAGLTPRDDAPNISRFLRHLRAGTTGPPPLANGLTAAASALRPEVGRLLGLLFVAGGHAGLSGSGSAVFGLFRRTVEARAAAQAIAAELPEAWVRVTRTAPRQDDGGRTAND